MNSTQSLDDRTAAAGVVPRAAGAPFSANALPAGTRLHEFELIDLIGEGGFGIVYLARDCVLERKVALKEYLPSALASRGPGMAVAATSSRNSETFQIGLRSFLNEARMLAQFDHPALVKVYRFWEANGTAYMVMPYYEGLTLKQTLARAATRPEEIALRRLLAHLLDALAVLHRANALHRDIAPDNILILADGTPVLLDFGAARRVITDRTQTLTVILKPGYAPLEQYAEVPSMKQGPWTDLYALAAVAYFAITGAAPTPAVARSLSDTLAPLEQAAAGRYSPQFLRALDRALALKPDDRPQTIEAFRSLLGLDRARGAAPSPPPQTTQDAARSASELQAGGRDRLRTGLLVGAAVALVAAIAAGAALKWRKPEPPTTAVTTVAPPRAPDESSPAPEPPPPAASPSEQPGAERPVQDSAGTREASERPPQASVEPPAAPVPLPVPRPPPSRTAASVGRGPAPHPPKDAPTGALSEREAAAVVADLEAGEKCFQAKQYDCAIASAKSALRVDPNSARAGLLKADAEEAQRRALSEIKIQ